MRHRRIYLIIFLAIASTASAVEYAFDEPLHDRWHYPFNGVNGTRPIGSCFGALADGEIFEGFNNRDAYVIFLWDTSMEIPTGQGAASYNVSTVRVILNSQEGAQWPVDTTVDAWHTYLDLNGDEIIDGDGFPRDDPQDTDGETADADAGRPIVLHGAGFDPVFTLLSWTQTSFYVGANGGTTFARAPYPFVYEDGTGNRLHTEDSLIGLHNPGLGPFTPIPWAVGVPDASYNPASPPSEPFDVTFDVDLNLSDGRVKTYFQEGLNVGRVAVIVNSLTPVTDMNAPPNSYPRFHMKEAPGALGVHSAAEIPKLRIVLCGGEYEPDLDGDCDVDIDDASLFASCTTGPNIGPPIAGCESADFDDDDDVDGTDFAGLQRCIGGPGVEPPASCETLP